MLPYNYGLCVSPDKKRRVDQVQVLVEVLLGGQVEQNVIRFRMQDVDVSWLRGQKGGQMLLLSRIGSTREERLGGFKELMSSVSSSSGHHD